MIYGFDMTSFLETVSFFDIILKKTYPGVDTVGEGLLDLISILLAFLIGNVVGVVNISSAVGSLFCEI